MFPQTFSSLVLANANHHRRGSLVWRTAGMSGWHHVRLVRAADETISSKLTTIDPGSATGTTPGNCHRNERLWGLMWRLKYLVNPRTELCPQSGNYGIDTLLKPQVGRE